MAIFNSYVSLPEGIYKFYINYAILWGPSTQEFQKGLYRNRKCSSWTSPNYWLFRIESPTDTNLRKWCRKTWFKKKLRKPIQTGQRHPGTKTTSNYPVTFFWLTQTASPNTLTSDLEWNIPTDRNSHVLYRVVAPQLAKLVHITPISLLWFIGDMV